MEYSKLVSVTGLPGLFELLSSKADGGVVKSLEDKSTKFVSTRIHNFSHLESIEVFTTKLPWLKAKQNYPLIMMQRL
jgi:hypothetical protein